jgi:hypothetical protein
LPHGGAVKGTRSSPWAMRVLLLAAGGAAAVIACLAWRRTKASSITLAPGCVVDVEMPARARARGPQSVVVVGAGIVGVAIAAELSRRGCHVTVLEQENAPGERATRCSWAWINANRYRLRPSGTKEFLLPNALPLCTCVAIPHSRRTQNPCAARGRCNTRASTVSRCKHGRRCTPASFLGVARYF